MDQEQGLSSDPPPPTSVDPKPPSRPRPPQAPSRPPTAVDPNAVCRALFTFGAPSRPPSSFIAAWSLSGSVGTPQFVVGASLRQPFGGFRRRVSPSSKHPSLSSWETLAFSFLLGSCLLFRETLAAAVRRRGGCLPRQPVEFNHHSLWFSNAGCPMLPSGTETSQNRILNLVQTQAKQ
ncbi:hypothetical protein PIB30_050609 [Stylosanthes scabra]|uniref:Uncharacterized protein n=1 Tax=Stylosanthes scabra TaxID=79078 RepID=A0ABU6XFD5_9FABA|nr:hypothetical protein [Stylosanthes scabra]